MDTEYKRVLNSWALALVPAEYNPVRVVDVGVEYEEGRFAGSPPDDPELRMKIRFTRTDGCEMSYCPYGNEDNALRLGDLLRQLFAIAEREG